jgi:hypothetical protein
MCRNLLLMLAFGAALSLSDHPRAGQAAEPEPPPGPVDLNKLPPGTSQAEVRRLLGPPKRVARQILYRRYLEQWVCDEPNPVRIEFDCVRGREPQILTVQPLTAPHP